VGTFSGHENSVMCAVEKDAGDNKKDYDNDYVDDNDDSSTLVTGSHDKTLKEWDTKTFECLNTVETEHSVCALMKTKRKKRRKKTKKNWRESERKIISGLKGGWVEVRRWSDLKCIRSFRHHVSAVTSIEELESGAIVSISFDRMMIWREDGTVLQNFFGYEYVISQAIELKNNLLVASSAAETLHMWKHSSTSSPSSSSGEYLRHATLRCQDPDYVGTNNRIIGLEKLSNNEFVTASRDQKIRLWNDKGVCLQTIEIGHDTDAMTTLGRDGIVIANKNRLEVWQSV